MESIPLVIRSELSVRTFVSLSFGDPKFRISYCIISSNEINVKAAVLQTLLQRQIIVGLGANDLALTAGNIIERVRDISEKRRLGLTNTRS